MKLKKIIALFAFVFSSYASNAQQSDTKIDSLLIQLKRHIKANDTSSLRSSLLAIERQNPNASKISRLYAENANYINRLMGKTYISGIIQGAIGREYLDPIVAGKQVANWPLLEQQLHKKYGEVYIKPYLVGKFNYAIKQNDVAQIVASVNDLRKQLPEVLDPMLLNNLAFDLFKKSSDKEALENILKWSDAVLLAEPSTATYYDTNANILYKLGRKEEALAKIHRAIELAEPREKEEFIANLEKMRQNISTW